MTDLRAVTILDTIGRSSPRFLTLETRYPSMAHQESLRHRWIYLLDALGYDPDFSFSVSSTRAVPFPKTIQEATTDSLRAAPVYWGRQQSGMSPGGPIDDAELCVDWSQIVCMVYGVPPENAAKPEWVTKLECARRLWDFGANLAGRIATIMNHQCEPHKSIPNRMIAPYLHSNVLMSGTERGWLNFFGLRLDGAADPILRAIAEQCWIQWNESTPKVLEAGQWHLPYASDPRSLEEAIQYHSDRGEMAHDREDGPNLLDTLRRMSVARCAHLSYTSFADSTRMPVARCVELHDHFATAIPMHASPLEHQATPDVKAFVPNARADREGCPWLTELVDADGFMWSHGHQAGNLGPGWRQYRKMIPGEAVAPLPEAYR